MRQKNFQEQELTIKFPTPLPLFRGAPNQEHLIEWAESQCTPMARGIAHKTIQKLHYVCFEDFLVQLKKTVADFHQKVPNQPYILLVGESRQFKLDKGCSDVWCIGLALEHCGLRQPEAILTLEQFLQYQTKQFGISHVLMLDDASYSAEQKIEVFFKITQLGKSFSFYVGIPFITRYAREILSKYRPNFRELIFLDHQLMSTMNEILDDAEYYYAKSLGIAFISERHALTYFDHRFADFMSSFQHIYEGDNLLQTKAYFLMNFLGKTYNNELAEKNKNIRLISSHEEYNHEVASLLFPNYFQNFSGYNIPIIISPYRLCQSNEQENLRKYLRLGKLGERTPYPLFFNVDNTQSTRATVQGVGYKKPAWSYEKQVAFDFAVMRNNHENITYVEQEKHGLELKKIHHELISHPPVLQKVPILQPKEINMRYYLIELFLIQLLEFFYFLLGSNFFEKEYSSRNLSKSR